MIKKLPVFICLTMLLSGLRAQPYIIDKIVGVVGKSPIQYSDIEQQYLQYLMQVPSAPRSVKCEIFEDLLIQKLMVTQAQVDSIEVTPMEVEMNLDGKIDYYINQVGSEEKLVANLGKSIAEIKKDMYQSEYEGLLMQRMRQQIVKEVTITPAEVKKFYRKTSPDSLPRIEAQFEVNQICIYPDLAEEAVFEVRKKLLEIREKVINGANFTTQAVLYSEGPSAPKGGDIDWANKADLDPAYAKAAFSLKKGQVSKIVESAFGYHIIQLIDRNGERIHTRHILMKPKIGIEAKQKAEQKLDSIVQLVHADSLTFEQAALRYSMDEKTVYNGGLMVNPQTQETRFNIDDFDSREYYILRSLNVGEISEPFESTDDNGKQVYKIFRLKSRVDPHIANLEMDFDLLKNLAVAEKQDKVFKSWIANKTKTTYIRIEEPYRDCEFSIDGWIK